MVLSGHVKGDGTGLLVSRNDDGKKVIQMLANYQFLEHGGQGWLRILVFKPREGKLEVSTYSPWLDKFREEPDQRFELDISHLFPVKKSEAKRVEGFARRSKWRSSNPLAPVEGLVSRLTGLRRR